MAVIGSVVKVPNTESPLTRKRNPQPKRVRNFRLWYDTPLGALPTAATPPFLHQSPAR